MREELRESYKVLGVEENNTPEEICAKYEDFLEKIDEKLVLSESIFLGNERNGSAEGSTKEQTKKKEEEFLEENKKINEAFIKVLISWKEKKNFITLLFNDLRVVGGFATKRYDWMALVKQNLSEQHAVCTGVMNEMFLEEEQWINVFFLDDGKIESKVEIIKKRLLDFKKTYLIKSWQTEEQLKDWKKIKESTEKTYCYSFLKELFASREKIVSENWKELTNYYGHHLWNQIKKDVLEWEGKWKSFCKKIFFVFPKENKERYEKIIKKFEKKETEAIEKNKINKSNSLINLLALDSSVASFSEPLIKKKKNNSVSNLEFLIIAPISSSPLPINFKPIIVPTVSTTTVSNKNKKFPKTVGLLIVFFLLIIVFLVYCFDFKKKNKKK